MHIAAITRRFIVASMGLVLAASSLSASAQSGRDREWESSGRDHAGEDIRRDGQDGPHGGWEQARVQQYDRRGEPRHGDGGDERGWFERASAPPGEGIHPSRGAGPEQRYFYGDRLPPEARRPAAVGLDWRDERLDPPPHGHEWIRLGSDFVLVAMATGIITQVILSSSGNH